VAAFRGVEAASDGSSSGDFAGVVWSRVRPLEEKTAMKAHVQEFYPLGRGSMPRKCVVCQQPGPTHVTPLGHVVHKKCVKKATPKKTNGA
jgi:hypothetical protein